MGVGRGHASDGESLRHAVRVAAVEVFGMVGFHAASMDEISYRAGVSKPLVYQHFPGKLALYSAVLQHYIDLLLDGLGGSLDACRLDESRVRDVVSAWFEFVERQPHARRVIFESDMLNEPGVRAQVMTAVEAIVEALVGAFGPIDDRDRFRMRIAAAGLVGSWWSAVAEVADTPGRAAAVDALAALCWRGLASVPIGSVELKSSPAAER
ncbi:TetR/AcrR family transcriptional regulator [Nocardia salmonicida]|uniref:TetR/AcrR family transcriptional regulator n=1 Tax=Nocardia salmonicida TaxID=53431 RepID=UPI00363A07F1